MTMMFKLFAKIAGMAMFVAAVAAQQPTTQAPRPSTPPGDTKPADPATPTAAQVLEQLRGAVAAAPATETPSMKTIVERYDAMIATGARAATTARPSSTPTSPVPSLATPLPARSSTAAAATTQAGDSTSRMAPTTPSPKDEEVRAILTQVRTLLVRLEALVGDAR